MKIIKPNRKRGAIMIEAAYCTAIVIVVLCLLLSLGFFLYQHAIFKIVANQVAEEVALTYKLKNVPDGTTAVTESDVTSVGLYRYWFGTDSGFKAKSRLKASDIAEARLTTSSLATDAGTGDYSVTVNVESDDIGRRHYKVTMTRKYSFIMGGALKMIGQEPEEVMTTTVYVTSVDASNYINTIGDWKYGTNKIAKLPGASIVNSFISAVNSAVGLLQDIFG